MIIGCEGKSGIYTPLDPRHNILPPLIEIYDMDSINHRHNMRNKMMKNDKLLMRRSGEIVRNEKAFQNNQIASGLLANNKQNTYTMVWSLQA